MTLQRAFLAFDTGRGLVYVQASGWQRAYLLWTFRNFRTLPQKILNARQRELVEKLYPAASRNLVHQLDEATLIGTVDNFISQPVPVSAAAEKLLPSIPAKKLADIFGRNSGGPLHARYARRAFPQLIRRVGAAALVAIMAVVSWQQMRSRPVVSASAPNAAAAPLPLAQIAGTTPITAIPPSTFSVLGPQESQPAKTSRGAEQSSNRRGHNQIAVSQPQAVSDLARTQDIVSTRMKISGPPRKLVYPVCPDSSTRGKVSLQAVVGYDGAVNQVRVLAGNRLLAAAATRAIREWRYQPFSGDAQNLERETRITVSFISNDVVAVSFPDAAQVSR